MEKVLISDLLSRVKNSIVLEDEVEYKRVTIKSKNAGIVLRDIEYGHNIGTKKQFIINKGQFLLSKIDARNGAFGIVKEEFNGAIITGNFWAYEVNKERLNIEWFNIFVSSSEFISICDKASSGTTNRRYLDETKFLTYQINLPSLKDQDVFVTRYKELSSKLDLINNEINMQEKYLKDLRNSILQDAVQGKLVPQDPNDEPAEVLLEKIREEKERLIKEKKIKKEKPLEEISEEEKPWELPRGWKWVRFTDIGEMSRGKSKHRPRNDSKLFESGKYPLVQTGDVARANCIITNYNSMYGEFGLSQSRLWEKGTLCITIAANIADSAILGFDACFPDSVVGFVPYEPIKIDLNKYFYYLINVLKKDLEKFAPATAQKNINLNILTNLIIPLPPLSEQKRIVEKVDLLMSLCDELENKIQKQKDYSNILMESIIKSSF